VRRVLWAVLGLVLVPPLLLALVLACVFLYGWSRDEAAGFDEALAERVSLSEPAPLVPGPGLPADLDLGPANNNLDAVDFAGRTFLAVRTARFHWASDDARLHVLSSADRRRWRHEATFDLERRDLREPRFLVLGDRLLFYFFEAADAATGFAPISIRASERRPDGSWTDSRPIFEPGHVVWRAKVRRGQAWMSVYDGRALYESLGKAGGTRLLRSEDGLHWTSVSGEESPIDAPGTSECAFELDAEGNLVALVRVEARGSLVCTAPAERLERWDCEPTPYRHDSPVLFWHEGPRGPELYAIARRSLGGPLDRGQRWLPDTAELLWYQLRYWWTRKRTTLYRVLPAERRTVPVVDLPSAGDTAFAAVLEDAPGRYWVANYSSDPDGPDWPWMAGQMGATGVYALELTIR
jgi:hypothetical protein